MTAPLLKLDNLKAWIGEGESAVRAVDGVTLSINKGETFALLGESGCGKSMTALAIMGLLPTPGGQIVDGSILFENDDLTEFSEISMRRVRGNRIAMIFQEPMTSLNPVLTVGQQISEVLVCHKGLKGRASRERTIELLNAVGIPDPENRINEYPHQLSGGMKQRVMISIALAGEPELLIADEPTTALDVTIQLQVLTLLKKLQQDTGMAMLLITHDLGVAAQMADRIGVMYAGQMVEMASRKNFFDHPGHPYSKKLFKALPDMDKRSTLLEVIEGTVPSLSQKFTGCRFAPRCEIKIDKCLTEEPEWKNLSDKQGGKCHLLDVSVEKSTDIHESVDTELEDSVLTGESPLLEVKNLKVYFPVHKGILRKTVGHVHAVDDVNLSLDKGKTLALVGESGCGKTTVGKGILQLLRQFTSGDVSFEGQSLNELSGELLRKKRSDIQIIFQDPYSSMNPRMRVFDIVEEGMLAQGILPDYVEREARIDELLMQVGLTVDMKYRYPHEFSGGQRQRICIARALAVNPKLIVCDEPTSALDVSVQAQILNLLNDLQKRLGLSYLFVTHDLSVVAYLAHKVAVMYLGRIVEQGSVNDVLKNPLHPYTRALLSAVPKLDPDSQSDVLRLEGDIPSPINPPNGCHFHPRCPDVMPQCRDSYPEKTGGDHYVRCFLY
ncbi:MAG: dipeptide ABC transporter ATP-binding protein [Gammaproteobacteria bacterium]|nr:dipeptide ABC transporter ATP-binding protein [Gammaproteobacteria bacterium]